MSHFHAFLWLTLLFGSCWLPVGSVQAQVAPAREQGVVFVAEPAGDFRLVVQNMERIVARSGLPLRVVAVNWATGDIPYDIRDRDNHQRAGRALAQRVLAYHKACPGRKVFLVGHSGGAAVVLAATHSLPANAVERIVLLAPGVSSHHDLRCALSVSRCGIDHFYSRDDELLRACIDLFGTNDGRGTRAAGEVGFVPIVASKADAALYRKLRQHPWCEAYGAVGNHGGHFGVARLTFVSKVVMPLLTAP